jgi:ABC-2 type transport system permease protein
VLVAPVTRAAVVLGQALGGTTLAVVQGALLLVLAPFAGLGLGAGAVLALIGVMTIVAFGLTSLGLVIAWRMESTQGFHAIMNLVLIPMWLLSGAFFPGTGLPGPLLWAMRLDPLTYGVAALRACFAPGTPGLPPLGPSLAVSAAFGALAWGVAVAIARRTR